jgi:hypothetical protein
MATPAPLSLLTQQSYANPSKSYWAASGGGGGGGGQNLVVSTIVMEGSADPLEITLPASANDGFSVRQGGANNPLAILTIDAGSSGQAEFGIRNLSTISGNPVPRGRFEMNLVPSFDGATLSYTLDTAGSGNASTIGTINFGQSDPPGSGGGIFLGTEKDASLTLGTNGYQVVTNTDTALNPRSATTTATNIYVPAAGTTQAVAQFSTIAAHAYELYIPQVRIQNQPAGVPAAGAWSDLSVDTSPQVTYLDTFDMASVSTVQNDLQMSRGYTFVATAAGHQLSATGSLANTLSTAMTFGNGVVFLRDLGTVAAMQPAISAP